MMTSQVVVLGDANVDMVIRLPDRAPGALPALRPAHLCLPAPAGAAQVRPKCTGPARGRQGGAPGAPHSLAPPREPGSQDGQVDLTGSEPQLYGGGSAANVAVALARLGASVTFVGSVGDDGFGRWVADDFAREGVDTRGLITIRDAFTPMVIALIEPDGERLVVVWPPERGADLCLRPEDVDRACLPRAGTVHFRHTCAAPADAGRHRWMAGAAWLHTTGMCLRASPVREAVLHGMALAREAGAMVSLDLNLRVELWGLDEETRQTVERAIDLSDVVLGSGPEEIAPVAGLDDVEAAARAVCDDQRVVVARLGAAGALAVAPEGTFHAPAFPTSVIDTLGAGDAFDAGFIAARLAGCDVHEALRWGNAVAALKIARSGARGTPSREELEQMLGTQEVGKPVPQGD